MRINKVTTHRGDDGDTDILGKKRIPKDSPLIECLGVLDELQSAIGILDAHLACSHALQKQCKTYRRFLKTIQNDLYDIGLVLMDEPHKKTPSPSPFTDTRIAYLETAIERFTKVLPPLSSFVLPGGDLAASLAHWNRTVCRRAERVLWAAHRKSPQKKGILIYANRLSDFFFVLSRMLALASDEKEILWDTPLKKKIRKS